MPLACAYPIAGGVPDSGTGELAGISGSFEILFAGKRHDYRFRYVLAPVR